MQRAVNRVCLMLLPLLVVALGSCGGHGGNVGDNNALPSPQLAAASLAIRLPHCPAPPTPLRKISTVHETGRHPAPIGQQITLRGVVTADFEDSRQLHGFFMQQATAASHTQSDGIFVYLPTRTQRVAAGSYIQVSGTVEQTKNRAGRSDGQLRLAAVNDIVVCGNGPPIPPRLLTLPVDDPANLDALDGMLVRLPQTLTVTDNHDLGYHGELMLSADTRLWQPYNHPTLTDPDDVAELNRRSLLLLGNASTALHPNPLPYLTASDESGTRRIGDTVTQVEGILTKAFGVWRLQPTQQPVFQAANPRSSAPVAVGGTLRVGSMNVLSFFTTLNQRGAKSTVELRRQRDKLVAAITALDADALGLMEIENSAESLQNLVEAINNHVGSNLYAAVDSGVQGSDAIKVALIYKPTRLTLLGDAESPPASRGDGGISVSRPSLAQHFRLHDSDASFWMVVNHLKSKSRCPADANSADRDTGQGCWNATRVRQANAIARWADTLAERDAQQHIVLLGDFNAYPGEDPIQTLNNNGYDNLLQRIPAAERYSYVFDGRSGALDHAFVGQSLRDKISGITIWHNNADEPSVLDYSTTSKPDDRYAPTPFRASDHDPLLVGLTL